jgi:hypothetical protein
VYFKEQSLFLVPLRHRRPQSGGRWAALTGFLRWWD